MRYFRVALLCGCVFLSCFAFARQSSVASPPQRDAQAVALLQQAVASMAIYDCVNSDLKPSSVSCCCGFVVLAWTREGVCNSW